MSRIRFTVRQLLYLTAIVGVVVGLWLHHERSATPRLFRQSEFNSALFAKAVNHFVDIGEDAAVRELAKLAATEEKNLSGTGQKYWATNERVGWMCRVLFEPKAKTPLRPPMFGGLNLPFNTMPETEWPLYPVAQSGSTYFVLSEGYMLGGQAEPVADYLLYCRQNGVFRTKRVAVPNKKSAQGDAASLRNSTAWQAIKWTDSGTGWSYSMDEKSAWAFIQEQADTTP
jgi:hypothetical protein